MWAILWWLFIYIVLPAGIAYLGGQLLQQDAPESEEATRNAQSTSWNPRTSQSEGIARPRAYGKNMHFGNIVSRHTDVDGDAREILYLVVEHGDGPTKGIGSNTVFLNNQPASNYRNVVIQERLGTMSQSVMAGFEKTKLQYNIGTELVYGQQQVFTTPNDFFDDLEYIVSFPRGIYRHRKNGERKGSSATLQVRIRPVDGAWSDVSPAGFSFNSLEPLYFNYKLSDYTTITRGTQYELEFTKLSPQGDRHVNGMSLRSVREIINVPFTRPGKALIGIKAIATAQLSGRLDVKVIREDRIINVFNGATWNLEYSRNRAWVVWDILTQPSVDGDGIGDPYTIERYDAIDPSYLDLNWFHAWSLFCEEEILDGYGSVEARAACDYIVDEFQDAFTLAKKIAAVGRAKLYWGSSNKLTGWIDAPVTTPTDLVTMDSIIHKSWKNNWATTSELGGVVEVLFQDARLGYEKTSAEYSSEDAGGFRNIISLEGIGLTSRGPVVHYAKYNITRNELIRNSNEFMVAKDGFRYSLGDVIRLQSRPANWGKAWRVMSSTADTITVDRDVIGDVTAGDVLHIRSWDSVSEQVITDTYEVSSVAGSVITATVNWGVTPVKGNLVATGPASAVKLRRIIKLQATTDNYFKVTVETYDTALFDSDDIDPSNPNVNYIWAGATPGIGAPVTRAELDDLIAQIIPPQPNIDVPIPANLTWEGDSIDTVTWSKTDADEDITFRYASDTDFVIAPDSTTDKFIFWDPGSPTVFLTTNLLSTAIAGNNWLMCINEDGVVSTPVPSQIMHGGLIQAGTLTANQIIVTGLDVLQMTNAPAEAGADVTSTHEAATIVDQGDLATIDEVDADVLNMTNGPAEAGADVTGGRLATINSSLLPNWRLDLKDGDGRPAGIYPLESINDFSQVDWLDSGEAEIKILSTPDATVIYGFPAIPIDDKQKYKIVIRHKSSAASANGLFLQLQQYNSPLPVGKTHIGQSSGGPNVQVRTTVTYIASNVAMPGTSWVVDEYTYTPSAGTKYASFGLVNWNPATAEVEYHVDYVLMYLIPKTADEVDESGSRKWAGETGADITGSHEGDINIDNIADGSTYRKMLANWQHSSDTEKMDLSAGYAASITSAQIGLLVVDSLHIRDNAVIIPVSSYTEASQGVGTIQTVDITVPAGVPVAVIAGVTVAKPQHSDTATIELKRNGNTLFTIAGITDFSSLNVPAGINPMALDIPGSGTHTYTLEASGNGTFSNRFIMVLGLKK